MLPDFGVIHDLHGIQDHPVAWNLEYSLYLDMVSPIIKQGQGNLVGQRVSGNLGGKLQVFILNIKGKTGGDFPSILIGIIRRRER